MDDKMIRQWILADETLYLEAREFGGGNDTDMYEKMPEFIQSNKTRLTEYIENKLRPKAQGPCPAGLTREQIIAKRTRYGINI